MIREADGDGDGEIDFQGTCCLLILSYLDINLLMTIPCSEFQRVSIINVR
jgi:hypothetical protein